MGNDDAKRLILARRARFVAAALATVTSTTIGAASVEACGGGTEDPIGEPDTGAPRPCLDVEGPRDAGPQPCLAPEPQPRDAGPQPCLSPLPPDSGNPQPCLSPPRPDAGEDR